jgi:hypothetical protein
MKEKSEELMKQVPSITIRTREELEAEGYDSDHITYGDTPLGINDVDESANVSLLNCSIYNIYIYIFENFICRNFERYIFSTQANHAH